MINPEWYRAVLRKYEPPVSWRPGDFVRSRLSGLDRMLSAGLLRLSPVSMPFVAGFLQGGGMDPGSPGGKSRSGFPGVPGYRAAPVSAPVVRAGLSGLSPFHEEPRGNSNATAPADISLQGLGEENSPARPGARDGAQPAGSGGIRKDARSPYSIPARRPALPMLFRKGAKAKRLSFVSDVISGSYFNGMGGRSGSAEGVSGEWQAQGKRHPGVIQVHQQARGSEMRGTGDVLFGRSLALRLKQGDVPSGKGRSGVSMKGPADSGDGAGIQGKPGVPVVLRMKDNAFPGPYAAADSKSAGGAANKGGGTHSGFAPQTLPLQDKAPVGGMASADKGIRPVLERSAGTASRSGLSLQPSAMGIRPRPALLEHVAQRAGVQRSRLNATSPVLQSSAVRARAGSLAREVAGRAEQGYRGAAGTSSEDTSPGNAGGSGILFPGAVSQAVDTASEGDSPGAHGAAAAFYGQGYPGILLPGPASGPGAPGGVSSGPALLQAKGYAPGVRQGAPPSFIFREAAVETPDALSGASGQQQASHTGDGGAGARTSSSQAFLAEGGGVEQEADSRAGLPGESSPGGVDIERLAGEVYLILERRLEMERESRGL